MSNIKSEIGCYVINAHIFKAKRCSRVVVFLNNCFFAGFVRLLFKALFTPVSRHCINKENDTYLFF